MTELLGQVGSGDVGARDELLNLVYDQLRAIAHRQLARERPGQTLCTTVLAHDAFLKLVGQQRATFNDRAHFLAIAALAMRRILINYAKARLAQKRGGGAPIVTFDDETTGNAMRADELVAVDDLVTKLSSLSERQSLVVVYRFYGGLNDNEIAEVIGVSVPTVRRDWRVARAWLSRELGQPA